jgi:xylan 1,4-beta-xylosidase
MGKPDYLSAAIVAELECVSNLRKEEQAFSAEGAEFTFEVIMPPQSVAAIQLRY